MKSNYIKSLQIKVAQHPEWDEDRIWEEAKKIYEHSKYRVQRINNTIWILPPISIVKGEKYEEQLYEISRN